MSVIAAVQLPEQPAVGSTRTTPLGGDGYNDPHSRTVCQFSQASDATGGNNTLRIRLDPRYTQIVTVVLVGVAAAVADPITGRVEFFCGTGEQWFQGLSMPTLAMGASGQQNNALWVPPLVLCSADPSADASTPPHIAARVINVDDETLMLTIMCYNFDKRARERSPIGVLMRSVPRTVSIT